MSARWEIIYKIPEGIFVKNQVVNYKNLGISLNYENDKLISIIHELNSEEEHNSAKVKEESEQHLQLFFEFLKYMRGIDLPKMNISVQKIQSLDDSTTIKTGFVNLTACVSICASIPMPESDIFTETTDSRLLVWLTLANDARKSENPAHAIRNYYMIWEDMQQEPEIQDLPVEANNLRLTRHFVSHGGELNNNQVITFVSNAIGKQVKRYDPTDNQQREFINSQRCSARHLIEKLIQNELDKLVNTP
jgi:hypothetical protein